LRCHGGSLWFAASVEVAELLVLRS
jgi:hypothetical protein